MFILLIALLERERAKYLAGTPTESMLSASDESRQITLLDWINIFQGKVKADKNHPVLLLLDDRCAHLSLEIINFCYKNRINLINLTQPIMWKDFTYIFNELRGLHADGDDKCMLIGNERNTVSSSANCLAKLIKSVLQ
jgi:hypothetical protein